MKLIGKNYNVIRDNNDDILLKNKRTNKDCRGMLPDAYLIRREINDMEMVEEIIEDIEDYIIIGSTISVVDESSDYYGKIYKKTVEFEVYEFYSSNSDPSSNDDIS